MLVFGESILNDAVSIVLTTTIVESGDSDVEDSSMVHQVSAGIGRCGRHRAANFFCRSRVLFILIWCCSTDSLFYVLTGFSWCSLALLGLELWWRCWVHLSWNTLIFTQIQGKLTTPFVTHYFKSEFPYSLEFGLMLCFTYVPYALAEVIACIEN